MKGGLVVFTLYPLFANVYKKAPKKGAHYLHSHSRQLVY